MDLSKGLIGSVYSKVVGPSAGATSTEFAGSAGVGAFVAMLPISDETKAWVLTLLAAVFTLSRTALKIVEIWKGRPASTPAAPPSTAAPRAAALLLVFALPALLLAGCAAPEAGRATSPVEAHLTIEWPRVQVPEGTFPGPVTVTATQTVTITPTSTADQTATTSVDAKAEVPGPLPLPGK